jgi:hypothetical protein
MPERQRGLSALAIVVAGAVAGFAIYTFSWREGQSQENGVKQAATSATPARTVFRVDSRPTQFGPTYAGITQGQALRRAREVVITNEYGGDAPLFYRNTGDAAIIQRTRMGGHNGWLVRFEDGQVPNMSCVAVRRRASRLIAAAQVRCRRT